MNKTVIVTGASGFLGSNLIKRLLENGYSVRGVSRSINAKNLIDEKNFSWIKRDLSLEGLHRSEFDGVDSIFHLAGCWRKEDTESLVNSNVLATIKLMDSVPDSISRIIFSSTQMVYGDPNSLGVTEDCPLDSSHSSYSCSKVCAENWLRFFQKKKSGSYLNLRFTGFVEGGGLIDYMIDRAINNLPIEIYGGGLVCRDYLSVENGIDALIAAEKSSIGIGFHNFNIGSGLVISAHELAIAVCKQVKSSSPIILSSELPLRSNFIFNISKAKMHLKFSPSNLLEVVEKYAQARYSISKLLEL